MKVVKNKRTQRGTPVKASRVSRKRQLRSPDVSIRQRQGIHEALVALRRDLVAGHQQVLSRIEFLLAEHGPGSSRA